MVTIDRDMLGINPYVTWLLIASALVILHAVYKVVYNVFFHPLRTVPGPWLWSTSCIPYILTLLTGYLPQVILALHEKYGDVVRVCPDRLSFTDPDAWRDIRGHRKAGQGEHPKDPLIYQFHHNNILGAPRADHSRLRRMLAHGFSAKSMQEQQPLITQYVDLLMDRLHSRTHDAETNKPHPGVVDLSAWFNWTTFDVIGDLAFGEPFYCLANSRYHPWIDVIFRSIEQFGWWLMMKWYAPNVIKIMKAVSSRYIGSAIDEQFEFAAKQVEKRLNLGASRPDFMESMITAETEDGKKMTRAEIVSMARVLSVAGSETTATTLTAASYFLAAYPEAQKKLAEEVRLSYASEDEIDLFSVNKLTYMLAVLDEAMRMFPPVPSHLPRVCQQGGGVICGYQVPGGTGLDIWPFAMNHCSRNFTEPDTFIPERWLDDSDGHDLHFEKGRHHALQPFSVGPRNCIGKNLAYVEMRLILARLVWNYDLKLADEVSERFLEAKTFSLWAKGPLNVCLTPVVRG